MSKTNAQVRSTCRVCGGKSLIELMALGDHYVSDFVTNGTPQEKAPLDLVMCDPNRGGCSLVQLKHKAVDSSTLYRNYWYKSGVNQTMRDALANISTKAQQLIPLRSRDIVIDIGANDGTLLRSYKKNLYKVGFEPARNLIPETEQGTNLVINDFFNSKAYFKHFNSDEKAKVITTIAMFYDLEDPNAFVADLHDCLAEDGIWINQMAYQPLMLDLNAFDNICHEHVEYYSLLSLEKLLDRHNLEVIDVELNDINGGSFRIYIKHKKNKTIKPFVGAAQRLNKLRKKEEKERVNTAQVYQEFARRVEALKIETVKFITQEVSKGKIVHVYGASTKGNTLLQYYDLNFPLISAAAERNPDKWGLKTVGTNIPIMSEEESRAAKPDYYLVLPWHFKTEFISREKDYLKSGGKMIFPLPEFEVISK